MVNILFRTAEYIEYAHVRYAISMLPLCYMDHLGFYEVRFCEVVLSNQYQGNIYTGELGKTGNYN